MCFLRKRFDHRKGYWTRSRSRNATYWLKIVGRKENDLDCDNAIVSVADGRCALSLRLVTFDRLKVSELDAENISVFVTENVHAIVVEGRVGLSANVWLSVR